MTERLDARLFAACDAFGDAVALEDAQDRLSYAGLAASAREIAEALRVAGLRADEPVLVPIANAPQNIAAFLGVWAAGGVVVPVSRDAPAAATEATRSATKARLMLSDGRALRIGDHPPPPERPLLQGAAIIIFTSGSTGAPKGVVIGHDAFARKLLEIDSHLNFTPATRALLVLQITFIFGIWFTLLTLLKGGSVVMRARFDAATLIDDLAAQGITDAAFVPTMLRKLLATDAAVNSPLRGGLALTRIHTGGEPFSPALGQRIAELLPTAAITDIYGLTETASSDFFLSTARGAVFASGLGRISTSERFRIADAQGRAVPAGEAGELQILTPFIMNGYLDQPALTQAAFADGYFRTGDLARLKPDGTPELVGRSKDLIARAGAKVSPLELDGVLAQHPAVAAALTVGVADEIAGERIHVLIVPRAGAIDEKELRRWVAERVEAYKRPDVYHFGHELPLGRTGKVDRDALRQRLNAPR
ncbi:MAG: AMP-binding protein [Pseudolabrys sp.]|nr:AMP-binding protein [Pseudolabrys sp.]